MNQADNSSVDDVEQQNQQEVSQPLLLEQYKLYVEMADKVTGE